MTFSNYKSTNTYRYFKNIAILKKGIGIKIQKNYANNLEIKKYGNKLNMKWNSMVTEE